MAPINILNRENDISVAEPPQINATAAKFEKLTTICYMARFEIMGLEIYTEDFHHLLLDAICSTARLKPGDKSPVTLSPYITAEEFDSMCVILEKNGHSVSYDLPKHPTSLFIKKHRGWPPPTTVPAKYRQQITKQIEKKGHAYVIFTDGAKLSVHPTKAEALSWAKKNVLFFRKKWILKKVKSFPLQPNQRIPLEQ